MGKNSKIAWTNHTFNPWWGCVKVSPGCANCYAAGLDDRLYRGEHWGKGNRKTFKDSHWNEVYRWNEEAKNSDQATKVFCGSMCDIFESQREIEPLRRRLWNLILDTPNLTWLLLTKRPENVQRLIPINWLVNSFPSNVWLGVTIENQNYINRIIQTFSLNVRRFVSVEPMLGPVSLKQYIYAIDWVIIGGESGKNCRPMELNWAYDLIAECEMCQMPVFVKQLGGYPDKRDDPSSHPLLAKQEFPKW